MANKTTHTEQDVYRFIAQLPDARKREDSEALIEMMREVTGEEPTMWGPSIIGFGAYHYEYQSGHSGDSCRVGFSPRKQNLTVYINGGFEAHAALLAKLGKHTTGQVCLYIKKLADVDPQVLRSLIRESVEWTKREYPT